MLVTGDARVRAGGVIYLLIGGIEAAAQGREIRCPQGMRLAISRAALQQELKTVISFSVQQRASRRPFLSTAYVHLIAMSFIAQVLHDEHQLCADERDGWCQKVLGSPPGSKALSSRLTGPECAGG